MQMAVLSRTIGIVAQTGSQYNYRTAYQSPIYKGHYKPPLSVLNSLYKGLINIWDYMLLKVQPIFDKSFCWKRIDCLLTGFPKVPLKAILLLRIREIGSPPKRTQQHPLGHVLTPKLHRLTEEGYF